MVLTQFDLLFPPKLDQYSQYISFQALTPPDKFNHVAILCVGGANVKKVEKAVYKSHNIWLKL